MSNLLENILAVAFIVLVIAVAFFAIVVAIDFIKMWREDK